MKHLVIWGLLLALVLPLVQTTVSEAAGITIRSAEREMKKDKDHQVTELYERAHRIIYGSKAPMGPDGRVRIAVVLTGDEWTMVEDRVKNQIYKQLRDKFPREDFALMKGTDVMTSLMQREEDVYAQKRNIAVGDVPLTDLRLDDYVWAGRQEKYDYVFAFKLVLGGRKEESHRFPFYTSITRKQNLYLVVRLVDTKAGDYAYRNNIVVAGESSNSGFNGRIFEKAIKVAMQEAMNDITFDEE